MELSPAMPRKDKIRYLVTRPGPRGGLPRHFWQPSSALRAEGWLPKRIPDGWDDFADAAALYEAAAQAAIALNGVLDRTRDSQALTAAAPPPPPAPVKRTVANLVAAYQKADAWTTLGAKTRRDYQQCIDRILAFTVWQGAAGAARIEALDGAAVKAFAAGMAATPSMMNACIRVLRLILNWGCANRHPNGGMWCRDNPAANPELEAAAVSGRIWPRPFAQVFVAKADALGLTGIGTAVVLDEWLGQREADILRMKRTLLRAGGSNQARLVFRQRKGTNAARGRQGAGVVLPVHMVPELIARIDLQLAWNDAFYAAKAQAARHSKMLREAAEIIPLHIILDENGHPYAADNFRHEFQRVRDAVEHDMLIAAGWRQHEATRVNKMGNRVDCLVWRNPDAEKRLHSLPPAERAEALERERRRDASFEIDYLLPGRDDEDPDAFRIYVGELQFMHLRHTAITRLGEANANFELISSVSGHSLKTVQTILERYMIRTEKMAEEAFRLRLAREAGNG